jgi:hypothetical protein
MLNAVPLASSLSIPGSRVLRPLLRHRIHHEFDSLERLAKGSPLPEGEGTLEEGEGTLEERKGTLEERKGAL